MRFPLEGAAAPSTVRPRRRACAGRAPALRAHPAGEAATPSPHPDLVTSRDTACATAQTCLLEMSASKGLIPVTNRTGVSQFSPALSFAQEARGHRRQLVHVLRLLQESVHARAASRCSLSITGLVASAISLNRRSNVLPPLTSPSVGCSDCCCEGLIGVGCSAVGSGSVSPSVAR